MAEKIETFVEELLIRLANTQAALESLRQGETEDLMNACKPEGHLAKLDFYRSIAKRQLLAIHSINQLILHEKDRRRLIQGACDRLVEARGYQYVAIALFDPDTGLIESAQSSTMESDWSFLDYFQEEGFTPCSCEVLLKQPTILMRQSQSLCEACPHSSSCMFKTAAVARLEYSGTVYGLLGIVDAPMSPDLDAEELSCFQEIAEELAFALHGIELEEELLHDKAMLHRKNRALHAINRTTSVLFRSKAESDLLEAICRIVVEEAGYELAWVGIAAQDDKKSIVPVAEYGFETGYLATLDLTWEDSERGRGPTGTAIRSGQPCCARNIQNDPNFTPWRDEAIQRGYGSSIALPLIVEGNPWGALNIYARETDAFDDEEIGLLQELAGSTVYGIKSLRTEFEFRRADEALRKSERQKELILNSTSEMIAFVNPDFTIVWANRAMSEAIGKNPEELIGTPFCEVIHQDGILHDNCPIKKVSERRATQDFEIQLPNGRHWYIRGYPVLDEDSKVIATAIFGQEMTDIKRAEEEKHQIEHQFHQAQKLESIGRLAGGVAHDLNNLLSPILGYSEMLLKDSESPPDRDSLNEIIGAAYRARDLVRQLLAFSRKQTLEFKLINLNDLITNLQKLLRRTIREDVGIKLSLEPDLPNIKGDIGQLEQVIMNLAVNAQDAMPDGGELIIKSDSVDLDTIYASQHKDVTPGPHVQLTVSDTGLGMDSETMNSIFEPFFTTKEKSMGTGLGLATVYGIVKQHGGNICVYSEVCTGTTFKLYFPVAAETIQETTSKTKSKLHLQGSETILLVEDNEHVRGMTQMVLEGLGYRILSAETGKRALAILRHQKTPVDLLLTDVVMPELNGKELYEQVRQERPNIKVLYMSGYTGDVIAHRGIVDPGVNFIQKPFSIETLGSKIRSVLDE